MVLTRSRHPLLSAAVAVCGLLAATDAGAHFVLQAPACWMSQDIAGLPEKMGPCGDEGGGTVTGMVTAFQSGQMLTITLNEVVFHPGHYRIALALNDRSQLPKEPTVAPDDMSPCGNVPIESSPVFPVLADGVFAHTVPFNGPQTIQIKLPDGVTCDKCTLQVIEFMAQHPLNDPGGCFYHHCADISIQATSVPVTSDLGAAADLGTASAGHSSSCSLAAGAASSAGAALFFGALLLAVARRRRPS